MILDDLAALRDALKGKREYLRYLVGHVKDVREGAFVRRAASCDRQIDRLREQIRQIEKQRDTHLSEDRRLRDDWVEHKKSIRIAKSEIMALELLCGINSSSYRSRKLRKSLESGGELQSATWGWIRRVIEACLRDDEELLDRLCREVADSREEGS